MFQAEPYRQVRLYDLGRPELAAAPFPAVRAVAFTAAGPYRFKMVSRLPGNELRLDEYNQWAQPPAALLERFVRQAFPAEASASVEITGEILGFEADLTGSEPKAVIEADYQFRDRTGSGTPAAIRHFRAEVPLSEYNGAAFAAAMTMAAGQLVENLRRNLAELSEPTPERPTP